MRSVGGQTRLVEGQTRLVGGQTRSVGGQTRLFEGKNTFVRRQTRLFEGRARSFAGRTRLTTVLKSLVSVGAGKESSHFADGEAEVDEYAAVIRFNATVYASAPAQAVPPWAGPRATPVHR